MTAAVATFPARDGVFDSFDFDAIVVFDDFVAAGVRWNAFKAGAKQFFAGVLDGMGWG